MNIYDFTVKDNMGEEVSLSEYKGKVLLVVNTASKCGFTPQYEELQKLYDKYKDKDFVVLAFPCNQFGGQEPGNDQEIKSFCSLNYGVNFPVFSKINVNGKEAHPLYVYLKKEKGGVIGSSIKWNFTKFLIDAEGNVVERYAPTTKPFELEVKIQELLPNK